MLVLYYALCPNAMSPRQTLAARWAMYASVIFGALDMIWKYFVKLDANPGGICDLYLKLPFADVSLAWVPFTILAFIIGWFAYERNGTTSTAKGSSWEMFDTGVACQNICLAAHAMGLGTCILASFDEDGVSRQVELPEDEEIIALVACGYPGGLPVPPRRKEVCEILRYRM